MIFAQDYPAPLEVIVVNDGKNEDVRDAVTRLRTRHRDLHITFTPMQARNLSHKKLAVTVGIKAASHDAVLHDRTTLHAVVGSECSAE